MLEDMGSAPEKEEKPLEEKKPKKRSSREEAERLQNELEEIKDKFEEMKNKYAYDLAEYDNFRKRSQKELESRSLEAKAGFIEKLLPVLDNFERASQNKEAGYEDYRKGVDMTVNQLWEILKGMNVEPFGEKGEAFDPNLHNAVMHIEDENAGENEIIDVFVRGYKAGERIIRPASVRVAN